MKLPQIVLLLGAGALAGSLITKLWLKPHGPDTWAAVSPTPSNVAALEVTFPATSPTTAEPPRSASVISGTLQHHVTRSSARAARNRPAFRRIQPASNPAPILLAKVTAEPALPDLPVSAPLPTIVPRAPSEAQNRATPEDRQRPSPHHVTLYTGLLIPARLVEGLSSQRNQPGDTFTAIIDQEIVVDGFVIVERGTLVEGRVSSVDRGAARLTVELTRLYTADGQRVVIQTESFEQRTEDPPANGENTTRGMRGEPATLPAHTLVRFRLLISIPLTERLG